MSKHASGCVPALLWRPQVASDCKINHHFDGGVSSSDLRRQIIPRELTAHKYPNCVSVREVSLIARKCDSSAAKTWPQYCSYTWYSFEIPPLPVTVYSPLCAFNLSASISYLAEILINAQEATLCLSLWRWCKNVFAGITRIPEHACSLHVASRRTHWHRHFVTRRWEQTALLAALSQQWREKVELLGVFRGTTHTYTHTYAILIYTLFVDHVQKTWYSSNFLLFLHLSWRFSLLKVSRICSRDGSTEVQQWRERSKILIRWKENESERCRGRGKLDFFWLVDHRLGLGVNVFRRSKGPWFSRPPTLVNLILQRFFSSGKRVSKKLTSFFFFKLLHTCVVNERNKRYYWFPTMTNIKTRQLFNQVMQHFI